jgi:hypothetical protein
VDDDTTQLSIALQDGFTGEEVIVRIDGREVNRLTAQTAWEISLATSFELSLPQGRHRIELEIPGRDVRSSHDVEVNGPTWLGVSVLGPSDVVWRESSDPFGYV